MARFWRWLRAEAEVYVTPWNEVIADRHFAATERMLTGWCGRAKVVGDRVVEAREARLQKERELQARAAIKRVR